MRLRRFLLRYYPPGIILEYEQSKVLKTKSIDLLDLKPESDVDAILDDIVAKEPLVTASKMEQVLRAHILPLTNVAFNKSGSSFITGSYDRTCKVWDTASGEELHTLEGHKNVVYAVAFNNPYGDKIATGSFDKTAKVCVAFNFQSTLIATGSMDNTAKLWDVQKGTEVSTLTGHSAEIICTSFNTTGDQLLTGSFDHTVSIWDVRSGRRIHTLIGHRGEISNAQFNFDCSLAVSGSMDKTCKIWDTASGKCIGTLRGHDDEVLDASFDFTGQYIVTGSADGTGRVYNAITHQCICKLEGHEGEISKAIFNPQGTRILTAGSDKTARLWDPFSGNCLQVLEGHTDEIFSCAFNYEGNIVLTVGSCLLNTIQHSWNNKLHECWIEMFNTSRVLDRVYYNTSGAKTTHAESGGNERLNNEKVGNYIDLKLTQKRRKNLKGTAQRTEDIDKSELENLSIIGCFLPHNRVLSPNE
eukprot:gene11242-12422_t